MTETKYREKALAIIGMYKPHTIEGPMRIHTQAINRIRRGKLMQ